MRQGNQFDTKGSMSVLLLGESGAGKSTLAMQWNRPHFILSDRNVVFAAKWAQEQKKEWTYDYCDAEDVIHAVTKEPVLDPDGRPVTKVVADRDRWKRSLKLLMDARDNPAVGTLVDDGLTFLEKYLQDHIVAIGSQAEKPLLIAGKPVMTIGMYRTFYAEMLSRITDAKAGGKPYVMCGHLSLRENELTKVSEWKPAIVGEMRDKIGCLFNEVWQLENEPVAVSADYPRGVKQLIRTAPTHRIKILRTTVGLPPVFEPGKCEEFQRLLKGL